MCGLSDFCHIGDHAEHVGGLDDDAGGLGINRGDHSGFGVDGGGLADNVHALGVGDGLGGGGIVRVQAAGQDGLLAARYALGHHHGLGAGGGAVVHRRIGHIEAGEGGHLGLELEQHLQCTLGDFRLIRRVAGQEFRALDDVIHGRGHMVAIGPSAAKERPRAGRAAHRRKRGQFTLDLQLAGVQGQIEWIGLARRRRYVDEQGVDIGGTDHAQHLGAVIGGEGQVSHGCPSKLQFVMARLVRATHDLRGADERAVMPCGPFIAEIIGPPDKPGDDEQEIKTTAWQERLRRRGGPSGRRTRRRQRP